MELRQQATEDRSRLREQAVTLHALAMAVSGMLIVAMNRYTSADLALSRVFFDDANRVFSWRHDPLWSLVLHDGLKLLVTAAWLVVFSLAVAAWRSRHSGRLASWRHELSFVAAVSLASALAVTLIKGQSMHSCPWSLAEFGGTGTYFRLFDPAPPSPGPGRCLPSGHASVGFMWIAAYFALRVRRPALARVSLLASLLLGLLAGFAQVVRGAHFASHVLLTAWICWCVALIGDLACRSLRGRRAARLTSEGRNQPRLGDAREAAAGVPGGRNEG
ncbi:MAG: phosphatase PAP2 family protein [Pseudomonadota bacterium]|jgi:membrane-associated PAP2 superfamily phosphatase